MRREKRSEQRQSKSGERARAREKDRVEVYAKLKCPLQKRFFLIASQAEQFAHFLDQLKQNSNFNFSLTVAKCFK